MTIKSTVESKKIQQPEVVEYKKHLCEAELRMHPDGHSQLILGHTTMFTYGDLKFILAIDNMIDVLKAIKKTVSDKS